MRPVIFVSLLVFLSGALGFGAGVWFAQRPAPRPIVEAQTPPAPTAEQSLPQAVAFADLSGWGEDAMADALPALAQSCAVFGKKAAADVVGTGTLARPAGVWHQACRDLSAARDSAAVREVLEKNFEAWVYAGSGTFTGYYEAELTASRTQDRKFTVPVYGVPRSLVTVDLTRFIAELPPSVPRQVVGQVAPKPQGPAALEPFFTRAEIDAGGAVAEDADVLVWADDPVAVHILHIQGSGRVTFPDGSRARLSFAAHNGHRFKGIGSILLEEKLLPPGRATMDNVRDWLRANPDRAQALMNRNARYIFFRLTPGDDGGGPIGALGIPLTPHRSLAVDPRFVPLGAPLWLETTDPDGVPIRRLMAAQDTGAAITGAIRGDVFWGLGAPAFAKAARMKSPGRYAVLVPRAR